MTAEHEVDLVEAMADRFGLPVEMIEMARDFIRDLRRAQAYRDLLDHVGMSDEQMRELFDLGGV